MANKTPLISVIIPVYNAGEFLMPCLDSISRQAYKNLEVLLIDDGSTDGSNEICDAYAEKDPRFKSIHKENGGVSSARNLGLDIAQGEYIAFIDADDRILPDYFEVLYRDLTEQDVVAAFCNPMLVDEDGAELPRQMTRFPEKARISHLDTLIPLARKFGVVWGGLFSAATLQGRRFSQLRYGEDSLFMFDWLCTNPAVSVNPYRGYLYLQSQNNATNTQKVPQLAKEIDRLTVHAHRYTNLPTDTPHIQKQFLSQYAVAYMTAQSISNGLRQDELAKHRNVIASRAKQLSKKIRIAFALCDKAPKIYLVMTNLYSKLRG